MSTPVTPSRFVPITTLVLWLSCAAVGGVGLVLHYPWPQAQLAPVLLPVEAIVPVELPKEEPPPPPKETQPTTAEPVDPTPEVPTPPTPSNLPAAPPPLAPPDAPAFTPVAPPTAAVAFAVPVNGPTRVVSVNQAAATRVTGSPKGVRGGTGAAPTHAPGVAPTPPQPETLVFGQGEGNQEKPDYPREALRRRQQGTVVIQMEVNEQGQVASAEVAKPCDFPLLNQAALRTVQKNWNFPVGKKRVYQVAIKFVLQ